MSSDEWDIPEFVEILEEDREDDQSELENSTRKYRAYTITCNNPKDKPNPKKSDIQVRYLIYQLEKGKKGTYHFQGSIYFSSACLWKNAKNSIDKIFNKSCHVEICGDWVTSVHYCSKPVQDCDCYHCKENPVRYGPVIEFGEPPKIQTKKDKDFSKAITLAQDGNIQSAMDIIIKKRPRDFALYGERIEANFEKLQKKEIKKKFELEHFDYPPLQLHKAVLVWGPPGTGKTNWALAHFNNPLLVRSIDKLREFKEGFHDGIVFDDMDFSHWANGWIINLLDMEFPVSVKARYKDVELPAGIPRIFCHNRSDIFMSNVGVITPDERDAVIRRFYLVHVQGNDLIKSRPT